MEKSISFTGYRPSKYNFDNSNKQRIFQNLINEIANAGKYGYYKYYFGAAPGFDLLAAHAVIHMKKVFDLKLICALPYEDFYLSDEFDDETRNEYFKIINRCDKIINVSGQKNKTYDCYMKRNRFMVDNSSVLICLYNGQSGGTQNTICYAKEKGLKIINVFPV